jgi:3-oxoadipate enol-lactonase
MPFAPINDHRLYFEDSGGAGPAVIFSHGFTLDHSMFDAQVAALAGRFRCITWDERGHGMSECRGPFDFYDSASDLMGVLDACGIERAVLVGMSQGGFLSQRAARRWPERVRALVLIDSAAALFTAEEMAGYEAMRDAWLEHGPIGEVAQGMAGLMFGPDYDASGWLGKWRSKPPSDWRHPWATVLGRDEFLPELAHIACPSMVVQGTEDQAFTMATAEGLRDALGDCRALVAVEGGHHAPNVTHADVVNRALADFLISLPD